MKQETRWFDRKFSFDHLHGTFPSIYERLDGLLVRLESKLETIPTPHLHVRPNNKWSIKEHIGHLIDLEELWIKRVNDFLEGKEILSAADLENTKTHQADHNRTNLADLISSLASARQKLLDACLEIGNEAESLTALHPRLMQPMRAIDLAYFVAEHDDHHLATITGINHRLLGGS